MLQMFETFEKWCQVPLKVEGARQQFVDVEFPGVAAWANQDNSRFRRREFGDLLAAAAAGGAVLDIIVAAHDDDDANRFTTRCYHGADCIGFGTTALRIRCVLDVAADMHVALLVEQCSADVII